MIPVQDLKIILVKGSREWVILGAEGLSEMETAVPPLWYKSREIVLLLSAVQTIRDPWRLWWHVCVDRGDSVEASPRITPAGFVPWSLATLPGRCQSSYSVSTTCHMILFFSHSSAALCGHCIHCHLEPPAMSQFMRWRNILPRRSTNTSLGSRPHKAWKSLKNAIHRSQ